MKKIDNSTLYLAFNSYLKAHRYDGLYNKKLHCFCEVDKLFSKCKIDEHKYLECIPAMKVTCAYCDDNECKRQSLMTVYYCLKPSER